MSYWLQIVGLMLLSSIKFLFAPATVLVSGFDYWDTILITTSGGWLGVLIFYYFGKIIVGLFMRRYFASKKKKQKFTRSNKLIIRIKSKFGIFGLALVSPVIISIPVGSILAARYFGDDKRAVYAMMGSVLLWSFALTTALTQFKDLF